MHYKYRFAGSKNVHDLVNWCHLKKKKKKKSPTMYSTMHAYICIKRDLKSFGLHSFSFMAPSLEFSAGHSKKCTNTVSIQIAAKNLLVCQGLPVESEEICVCVWQLNVDGCIWIGRGEGGRERA